MKSLELGNYIVRPFVAKKHWYTGITSGSSGSVTIQDATYSSGAAAGFITTDQQHLLYQSIRHVFGNASGQSKFANYGFANYDKLAFPVTESSYYVLNVHQNKFGERVVPESFILEATDSSVFFYDNGQGKIFSSTNVLVGVVFYDIGIAIIKKSSGSNDSVSGTSGGSSDYFAQQYFANRFFPAGYFNASGSEGMASSAMVATTTTFTSSGSDYFAQRYFSDGFFSAKYFTASGSASSSISATTTLSSTGMNVMGSSQLTLQHDSTVTIYENSIICTVEPNEFNFSLNPTLRYNTLSGSISASNFTQTTGSTALQLISSGTMQPYFTSVGLFNDMGEMVAIAKLPNPIKRASNVQQTIIVRIDM